MITPPSICTPITGSTLDEFEQRLALTQKMSDFVELRIDSIPDLTPAQLTHLRSLTYREAICTCRVADQGGMGGVDEKRRIGLIRHALTLGFAYIDIEHETMKQHDIVILPPTRLILSAHIFTNTPPDDQIQMLIRQMEDIHPAVIKIAVMTQNHHDCARVLRLIDMSTSLVTSPTRLLLIGMGEQGRETRIQGPLRGCPWTYAATPWTTTAPGQLSLSQMQQIYAQM